MSAGDPPIIITGGSVSIEFDDSQFQQSGHGRFMSARKEIKRVEITGDDINFAEYIPNGKVTIKIYYGDR